MAAHPVKMAATPAKLLSCKMHMLPAQLLVAELFFEVPLDYEDPSAGKLTLFGRAALKYEKPIVSPFPNGRDDPTQQKFGHVFQKPWMIYLEGGPGMGNREPQDNGLTKTVLNKGYQILYLDYRGTGLSTPVNSDSLQLLGGPQAQADYLKLFRADSIVKDCEAVRECLTAKSAPDKRKWSLFGQSFGGFVSMTYLSFAPAGVREVFLTGGLAPIGKPAEDVYRATYQKLIQRNEAYFRKFPEDVRTLYQIAMFFHGREGNAVQLPNGGQLTFQRVLTLGQGFGFHGGLDQVHGILVKMKADLDQIGWFTRATLSQLEQFIPFDIAPIYAILHEPLYCDGPGIASKWAADKVGKEFSRFSWLKSVKPTNDITQYPTYFAGEMIYPFMFDTYPELQPLKEAANILAEFDDWDELYDEQQLAFNEVPVYAASFVDDLYVDFDLARETAQHVGKVKVFETNAMYHNAIRAKPDEVVKELFKLRDETID